MNCLHGIDIESNCDDCNNLLSQISWCRYCGDGIPNKQMAEHLEWCEAKLNKSIVKTDEDKA